MRLYTQMSTGDGRSDRDLLAAAARDPEAFAFFYRRMHEAVFSYFMNRTRRSDLAADLTAETFAAALAGARRFRGGASDADAPAWLFRIARNKLIDSVRRGRVEDKARRRLGMEPLVLEDDELAAAEARIDFGAHETWLADALAALPDTQRDAILAHVVRGQPYEELAAELECSPAVVRKRVSRGLAELRVHAPEEL